MAKHRDWDREVTIYVWRFHSVTHMGHAAVKLRGFPGGDAYISWWPDSTDGGALQSQLAKAVPSYQRDMVNELNPNAQTAIRNGSPLRPGQRIAYTEQTLFGEFHHYGQTADEKIKLPGLGTPGLVFGLDMGKMLDWWNVFRRCPHPKYKMVSKHTNCTGVAAAALKIGGADQFVKAPTAAFFISPDQIAKWAHKVRAELEERNEAARRLAMDVEEIGDPPPALLPEIMSVAEWTTLSNKNMGGARMRSDKVQKIDRVMREYHSQSWSRETVDRKWRKMGELMDTIHQYLIHKAGSKRGDSVVTLGRQVLAAVKYKAMEYRLDDAWAR